MHILKYTVIAVAIALLVFFIWMTPNWFLTPSGGMSANELVTLEHEVRRTLTQIITAAMVLFGLFLIYLRVRVMEKSVETTRDVQITDRFSRAVEQLGTYKLEIQLGGIFTLEKIAQESQKQHWIIMEIFTAYVRENSPHEYSFQNSNDYSRPANGKDPKTQKRLPTNIQAILSVIGRRNWLQHEIEHGLFLNLRKTNLKYADFRNAVLIGTNFRGSNLARANLMGANLGGAFLAEANLRGTNLIGCNLQGADLRKANFEDAKLSSVNFEGANFAGANIKGADLSSSILKDVNFNSLTLTKITYDEQTIFPEWLNQKKRDELGMVFELT